MRYPTPITTAEFSDVSQLGPIEREKAPGQQLDVGGGQSKGCRVYVADPSEVVIRGCVPLEEYSGPYRLLDE